MMPRMRIPGVNQQHGLPAIAPWPLLALLAFAPAAIAQQAGTAPVAPENADAATAPATADLLGDALACRVEDAQLPGLLARLRRERPDDFVQAERQYSAPDMDLYRPAVPAQAWGNESDAVAIAANRVMLAVAGSADEISHRVDQYLEQSRNSPLPALLDEAHVLVVYPADRPGLEGRVLVGCEYRIDGLSLLDDPADAWRKPATPP